MIDGVERRRTASRGHAGEAPLATVEPVENWAEDFEIFDAAFVADPYPVWKDLRDQGCPFARS